MALDKNLFTLNIEQSKVEPSTVDLVDPSGTVHYRKRWIPDDAGTYLFSLSDPLSESLLATATAPSVFAKEKLIELHNPSVKVPLSSKGTLTSKWTFAWEQHQFEWKRDECHIIRKPDPPVLVAIHKEPPGKLKTSLVQILDYNLNRFDVDDRKGLEIVLLTALLTIYDQSEQSRAKPSEVSTVAPVPNIAPAVAPRPPRPSTPERSTDDQIAILQAKEQREINEVIVGVPGTVEECARHCVNLLNEDTLLFITLRSQSPQFVSKVVQVAEATKRMRYKSGAWDEELHQYIDLSTEGDAAKEKGKAKGPPRVINLDDNPSAPMPPSNAYKPPSSLTIHLSKISMPELEPKTKRPPQHFNTGAHVRVSSDSTDQHQGAESSTRLSNTRTASSSGLRLKFKGFSSSPPPGPRPSTIPQPDRYVPASQAPHPQAPPHMFPNANSQSGPPHAGPSPPSRSRPLSHHPSHPMQVHPNHPPNAGRGAPTMVTAPPKQPPQQQYPPFIPSRPGPYGYPPLSGPGAPNFPPGNPAYAMYPAQFAPQVPPQSGGFLDKFRRRRSTSDSVG